MLTPPRFSVFLARFRTKVLIFDLNRVAMNKSHFRDIVGLIKKVYIPEFEQISFPFELTRL